MVVEVVQIRIEFVVVEVEVQVQVVVVLGGMLGLVQLQEQQILEEVVVEGLARLQADTVLPAVTDWRDMKATGLRIES